MKNVHGVDQAGWATRLAWLLGWLLVAGLVLGALRPADAATGEPVLTLDRAAVVQERAFDGAARSMQAGVTLPDDWSVTRPGFEGRVTYRLNVPEHALRSPDAETLQALYIPRACANVAVRLNGHLLARNGRIDPPVARNCYLPQLISLPAGLVIPGANMIELEVAGFAQEHVAARQRAGGLSAVLVGPEPQLRPVYQRAVLWAVHLPELASLTVLVLGLFMGCLAWVRRSEPGFAYFTLLLVGWAVAGGRLWLRDLPYDHWAIEVFFSCLLAPVVACVVIFLQRHAGERHRWVDALMLLQCVAVPLSIMLSGMDHFFTVMATWSLAYVIEIGLAAARFLQRTWAEQRSRFWTLAITLGLLVGLAAVEVAVQWRWLPLPPVHYIQFAMPLLFMVVGARLLQQFTQALQAAEAVRSELESRVNEKVGEIERSYAHLAELRIEQVAEAERKRIAGDLHDDLGAKLLTIVHTSGDDRISTLAREALEEMRLSVRGLTGKPVKIADALADWRAETVSRLGQSAVEVDWLSGHENDERHLSARAYVQTTRILREAVSNIIKHSGANACSIRCVIDDTDFNLVIQDNGRGIPMELDGKLDRGHGMASMKRRAKQLAGQCLVESGPGYGTVIRLTLPL